MTKAADPAARRSYCSLGMISFLKRLSELSDFVVGQVADVEHAHGTDPRDLLHLALICFATLSELLQWNHRCR